MARPLVISFICLSGLVGCSRSFAVYARTAGDADPGSDSGGTGAVSAAPRVDPSFTEAALTPAALSWYQRLWAALESPAQHPAAATLAASGDTTAYAVELNQHVTALLLALRVVGDPRLLDEIDDIAEAMRAQLADSSILTVGGTTPEADGYLNWVYELDDGSGNLGTDVHVRSEMLTHTLVAAMTHAFWVNRDLDARWQERVSFWTTYLQHHFEAKWRVRNAVPSGYPFLTQRLTYAWVQWIRYHWLMCEVMAQPDYCTEARRLADLFVEQAVAVTGSGGTSLQWDHGMTVVGENSLGAESVGYAGHVFAASIELALSGLEHFRDGPALEQMATTVASLVLHAGAPTTVASAIDGSGTDSPEVLTYRNITQLAGWDATGRIATMAATIHAAYEPDPDAPNRVFIPAGMVFALELAARRR